MLKRFIASQAGDTIVEVLLAIAIGSFVLMTAYVTANKNALINQDTQERSQALQLATAQVEFLHVRGVGMYNCFGVDGSPAGTTGNNAACVVKGDGTPAVSGEQPAYTIAITDAGSGTSKISVTWASLASSTQSSVVLYYQSNQP